MTDSVFNPGDLPVGAAEALKAPLSDGGVRLPFPAPVLWWRNGDRKMKQLGGVEYYGGWAISADELEDLQVAPPEGFAKATWSGKENDYDVYCGRYVGFAPIARRQKWEQAKAPDGTPKGYGRSSLQVLGVAATWDADAKQFLSYGPVVLSAKGWTAKHLQDALREFERVTAEPRKALASNLPANFFYAPVGSFGDEPNVVIVGKGPDQSPITPPTLRHVETYNAPTLQAMYLGPSTIQAAIEWKQQADEWMKAWDKPKNGDNGHNAEADGGEIPF